MCSRHVVCWSWAGSRRSWTISGVCPTGGCVRDGVLTHLINQAHLAGNLLEDCLIAVWQANPRCLGSPGCRQELEPFTRPKPLSVLERMGLHTMPTSAQLVAAGRRDLSDAVKEAGGFLEVAQVGSRRGRAGGARSDGGGCAAGGS